MTKCMHLSENDQTKILSSLENEYQLFKLEGNKSEARKIRQLLGRLRKKFK